MNFFYYIIAFIHSFILSSTPRRLEVKHRGTIILHHIQTVFTFVRMDEPRNLHALKGLTIVVDSIPILLVVIHVICLVMTPAGMGITVVRPQCLRYEDRALVIGHQELKLLSEIGPEMIGIRARVGVVEWHNVSLGEVREINDLFSKTG